MAVAANHAKLYVEASGETGSGIEGVFETPCKRVKRSMTTKFIRNSTAEFLIFTGQSGEQSIETRYKEDTIWLSQKLISELFDVDVRTVSEHFKKYISISRTQ